MPKDCVLAVDYGLLGVGINCEFFHKLGSYLSYFVNFFTKRPRLILVVPTNLSAVLPAYFNHIKALVFPTSTAITTKSTNKLSFVLSDLVENKLLNRVAGR